MSTNGEGSLSEHDIRMRQCIISNSKAVIENLERENTETSKIATLPRHTHKFQ